MKKKITIEEPSEKMFLGRLRRRWINTIKRDLANISITFNIDIVTNENRRKWRRILIVHFNKSKMKSRKNI